MALLLLITTISHHCKTHVVIKYHLAQLFTQLLIPLHDFFLLASLYLAFTSSRPMIMAEGAAATLPHASHRRHHTCCRFVPTMCPAEGAENSAAGRCSATSKLHLSAVAILGLGVSIFTKILPFIAAFSGFGDPIPWLVCLAFFFAKGFIKPGLGNQVAYQFVSLFRCSSLGLGYSLVFSEALLASAIPLISVAPIKKDGEREKEGDRLEVFVTI
ncbi:hypothetical protein AHAS_Ahas17G0286100 [Arachis hypogaea]